MEQTGNSKLKKHEQASRLAALRAELVRKIMQQLPAAREKRTAVPSLSMYRRAAPTPCNPATYEPSLSVFLQGRKRIYEVHSVMGYGS